MALKSTKLVGDIGGTNARFALVDEHHNPCHAQVYRADQYASLHDAINHYLQNLDAEPPTAAAIAVATRVLGDKIEFTNNERWSFSTTDLAAQMGVPDLCVVNDFTALALAVPHLSAAQLEQVGQGKPKLNEPMGVIGPGTGCGVSGLIPVSTDQWRALNSEGGHCSASVSSEREMVVFSMFAARFGHVSFERFLSGPGLVNIVTALREIDGVAAKETQPETVTREGLSGADPQCTEALEIFCALLGSYAGDLSLMLGASGGVFVGGGIVPRLGDFFAQSQFRTRFENKGRVTDELVGVPTYVIKDPYPGLRGAARLLVHA